MRVFDRGNPAGDTGLIPLSRKAVLICTDVVNGKWNHTGTLKIREEIESIKVLDFTRRDGETARNYPGRERRGLSLPVFLAVELRGIQR